MIDCVAIFFQNGISSLKQDVTQSDKISDVNHSLSIIQQILASQKLEILLIKEWQKPLANSNVAGTGLSAVV